MHVPQDIPPSSDHHLHSMAQVAGSSPNPGPNTRAPHSGKREIDSRELPPSSNDFVRRLHWMLENNVDSNMEWSSGGESFVIRDSTLFTRSTLPRLFGHSNFVSFVRQLNKYSFRKIRSTEDGIDQGTGLTWIFKHEHFKSRDETSLELVKRNATPRNPRKSPLQAGGSTDALLLSYQRLASDNASLQQENQQLRMCLAQQSNLIQELSFLNTQAQESYPMARSSSHLSPSDDDYGWEPYAANHFQGSSQHVKSPDSYPSTGMPTPCEEQFRPTGNAASYFPEVPHQGRPHSPSTTAPTDTSFWSR